MKLSQVLRVVHQQRLGWLRPGRGAPILRLECQFCTATIPTSVKSKEDSRQQAFELLKTIVAEHSTNRQRTFVLPWADQQAINSVLYPFAELMAQGVLKEFLLDACLEKENLFRAMTKRGRHTYQMLLLFVENFAMSFEDAIRLFADWSDELAEETTDSVQKRLSVFLGRGIRSGGQLRRIVTKCPDLMFTSDAQKMDVCLEQISNYFQANGIRKLMHQNPHICLLNPRELEQKYEYIFYHMGIESSELIESQVWLDLDLDQIMARHELLTKTGKYFFPDPKRPQFKKENPTAMEIFDVSDHEFAEKLAKVSHEEWVVFREVLERQKQLENKEQPFERVKHNARKRYERRLKEPREPEEGEIED